MPKPENTGQGLAGKTRTLTADVGELKAGDQVKIVSQSGNERTVEPVAGGAQVTVSANQLQGGDGDDEPEPPAEGVTVQSGP